jgi:uncharacterized protein
VVSVNVAQLMLAMPGTVREFEFSEPLRDLPGELHLRGPVSGDARLMRTSDGVLVTTHHSAPVALECARCLEDVQLVVEGALDEEFLPTFDIHTGLPVAASTDADEQLRIDEHHEIDLDEILRQNILTNLPLRPLCEAACPGLCSTCGERLDTRHASHSDASTVDASSPFAKLAVLLNEDEER